MIEAIYGGTLASDWDKVKARLGEKGIDPEERVGYQSHGIFKREAVLEKIKRLRDARDDKAAHGRIHANRKSTYYELMDYQQLARHVLSVHIAFKYPSVGVNL